MAKQTKWMEHVLNYKKEHNVSFKEAMTRAKKTYKKQNGGNCAAQQGGVCTLNGGRRRQSRQSRQSRQGGRRQSRRQSRQSRRS